MVQAASASNATNSYKFDEQSTTSSSDVKVKFTNTLDVDSTESSSAGTTPPPELRHQATPVHNRGKSNIKCTQVLLTNAYQQQAAETAGRKKTNFCRPCEQNALCRDFLGARNKNCNVSDHFVCSDVEGYFNPACVKFLDKKECSRFGHQLSGSENREGGAAGSHFDELGHQRSNKPDDGVHSYWDPVLMKVQPTGIDLIHNANYGASISENVGFYSR